MAPKHRRKPQRKNAGPRVTQETVLQALKDAHHPLRRNEILAALKVKKEAKRALKEILKSLEEKGKLIRTKGGTYGLTQNMSLITGTLEIQRSGVGFLLPEDKRRKDVFISPNNFGDAWNGDRVVAALIPTRKGKNPEGRIVRILDRKNREMPVRLIKRLGPDMFVSHPTDTTMQINFMVDTQELEDEPQVGDIIFAKPGEKLDAKLWAADATVFLGAETSVAVQEGMVKMLHGIPQDFPSATVEEAQALPDEPSEAEFEGRRDMRETQFVTIDGASARDFDDAIYVRPENNGHRLFVAIADVSHYVQPGSALDQEALERGNSYYFPTSVEPMFPVELSNGLCSLNPNVNRLAMVAEMFVSPKGKITEEQFYPAVICSHARLTYDQVHSALELNDDATRAELADVLPMLESAEKLARQLNALRKDRGTLDFEIPEPLISFDDNGVPDDIQPRKRNFAHQLIEEFMIAANEAVARFLEDRGEPALYRIHPSPDADKLRNAFKMLRHTELGQLIPDGAGPSIIPELLHAATELGMDFIVGRLLLRSMMQASYSPMNDGHFGLASESYCHFTSPIRRYADLIVHRALKAATGKGPRCVPQGDALQEIADQISGRERVAMRAEREILKRVTILFLQDKVGEDFTGIINGVADYGFWVELNEIMAEGSVRLSSLSDDYYAFIPERQEIWGERTKKRFFIGQPVRVYLSDVNLSRLEITLELIQGKKAAFKRNLRRQIQPGTHGEEARERQKRRFHPKKRH